MRGLIRDLRYAARSLRHSPGLMTAAVLSLALGMSVNTMLYSAVRGLLFGEVTAADPGGLVLITITRTNGVTYPQLEQLRGGGILDAAAGERIGFFSARGAGEAHRVLGELVTADYFDVLGVRAAFGRTFASGETRVAVLSYGYWQRVFGGDTGAAGRPLSIDGQEFAVIGVLPREYRSVRGFGLAPEIYLPFDPTVDGGHMLAVARMRRGYTRDQTRGALAGLSRRTAGGAESAGGRIEVFGTSAAERLRVNRAGARIALALVLLTTLCGTALLIACSKAARVLLARAAGRRRETALGASGRHIVPHLVAESLVVAVPAAACGWLLSSWTTPLLAGSRLPLPLPVPLEWSFDAGRSVFPFELLLVAVTVALCALPPAREALRVSRCSTNKVKGG